jgi:hypothetical protein
VVRPSPFHSDAVEPRPETNDTTSQVGIGEASGQFRERHHRTKCFLGTRDVAGMSVAVLQEFLEKHGEADLGGATVSRTPDHVFINFGFET